ncbi:MAG: hypothetical protein EBU97_01725, partial [Rhodobacteraceae bacterium]|nr:hypothetical protein [Paracoccaceae bacterium]
MPVGKEQRTGGFTHRLARGADLQPQRHARPNEFRIGATAVDGNDAFDAENVVVRQLANGNIAIGYVETSATNGTAYPYLSVIDPTKAPGAAGFAVASDVQINTSATNPLVGPPQIEAFSDGRLLAVWVDGQGTSAFLKYRYFSPSGAPLGPEQNLSTNAANSVSLDDNFDWNHFQITVIDGKSFTVSWVGNSDTSGTGIFTSGPVSNFGTVDGTAAGDLITPTSGTSGTSFVDAQGDQLDAPGKYDNTVYGGAGNDTLDGGQGADTLYGGAGDDRLILTDIQAGRDGTGASTAANQPQLINTSTPSDQSPPISVVLNDGRVMEIWSNYATSDDIAQMQLQGRILNTDGTPATAQFALGSWAIDGTNAYDVPLLAVEVLRNGNVVVAYERNWAEQAPGQQDEPVATILNPSFDPSSANFIVARNIELQQNDTTALESPPTIEALADGRFLAVWSKNGLSNDVSCKVQARIFNADGTPATNEFQVGSFAVAGNDRLEKSTAETAGGKPIFTVVTSAGATVRADVDPQQNDTTTYESPPVLTALADGRLLVVWSKDALNDNSATMTIQGRIFNADGTAATNEFRIGATAVDGTSTYNADNLSAKLLSDGRVVVDPSKTPGAAGFAVASDVQVNTSAANAQVGPPVIAVLADGRFVAAWSDGDAASTVLKFRVFSSNGTPLTNEVQVSNSTDNGVSGSDAFDWPNISVAVTGPDSFILSWAGNSDGNGTGVYSSATIQVADYLTSRVETLVGGETAETTGDTLDASAMTASVSAVFSATEAGQITQATTGAVANFSQIEHFSFGSGNDTINAQAATAG